MTNGGIFININLRNFGVASNLHRSFSEDLNAGTALTGSYSSCLIFFVLGGASNS